MNEGTTGDVLGATRAHIFYITSSNVIGRAVGAYPDFVSLEKTVLRARALMPGVTVYGSRVTDHQLQKPYW